jgi:hypothetical protein
MPETSGTSKIPSPASRGCVWTNSMGPTELKKGLQTVLGLANEILMIVTSTTAILDWCVSCQRKNASTCDEVPADLPAQRLRIEDPFSVTWIDFAGSF